MYNYFNILRGLEMKKFILIYLIAGIFVVHVNSETVIITSDSHPDPNLWYNTGDVSLSWEVLSETPTPTETPEITTTPTPTPEEGITTIILFHGGRLKEKAGWTQSEVDEVRDLLKDNSDFASRIGSVLMDLELPDIAPGLNVFYQNWDTHTVNQLPNDLEENVRRAQIVSTSIKTWLKIFIPQNGIDYSSLKYILIVGDDRIIPFYRAKDYTESGSMESDYSDLIDPTIRIGAALGANYILTDDYYGDHTPSVDRNLGRELFMPDLVTGRLVEDANSITSLIERFLENNGKINADSVLVVGTDWLKDGATRIEEDLKDEAIIVKVYDPHNADELCSKINTSSSTNPKINFFGLHSDHYNLYLAGHDITTVSTEYLNNCVEKNLVEGEVIYSLGSHSGLNVPPEYANQGGENISFDHSELWLNKGIVTYIGPTTFAGYGREYLAYSEDLGRRFMEELFLGTGSQFVGIALKEAKERYLLESFPGVTNIEQIYANASANEKTLIGTTIFGLPMLKVESVNTKYIGNDNKKIVVCKEVASKNGLLPISYSGPLPEPTICSVTDGTFLCFNAKTVANDGEPIQPKDTWFTGRGEYIPKGVVMEGAIYDVSEEFDPVVERAGWGPEENIDSEGELKDYTKIGWFPSIPFLVNTIVQEKEVSDNLPPLQELVVVGGQYNYELGAERLYTEVSYTTYFLPENTEINDNDEPIITDVKNSVNSSNELVLGIESDEALIRCVVVLTDGKGEWWTSDLGSIDEAGKEWSANIPVSSTVEYFIQAVDTSGNVAYDDNDGRYYTAVPAIEPPYNYKDFFILAEYWYRKVEEIGDGERENRIKRLAERNEFVNAEVLLALVNEMFEENVVTNSFVTKRTKVLTTDVSGYYYLLDQISNTEVTDENAFPPYGGYTPDNGISYTGLNEGIWYFHLRPLDELYELWPETIHSGTININLTPPILSSSSHPDQEDFYTYRTVTYKWSDPAHINIGSVSAYYYIQDHSSDTEVNIYNTSLSPGQHSIVKTYSEDGTWYFHIAFEDQEGNISPSNHYRVNLGEPPTSTPTSTVNPTNTPTITCTPIETITDTPVPTNTLVNTSTATNTPTITDTPSSTYTNTYTPTITPTLTPLPTFVLTLPGDVNMEFVRIPAGSFLMGASDEGWSKPNEEPIHSVTIEYEFYMGKYEVTQAQWLAVIENWPGENPPNIPNSTYGIGENYPAYFIPWDSCQDFITEINKLNQGTFRLPSEAEWEYCCRAGSSTIFHFGDSDDDLSSYAWWSGNNGDYGTKEVGQLLPNSFGLFDMHGNIYEWCEDAYHDSYIGAPTTGIAWLVPPDIIKILRGGCWNDNSIGCRSSNRNYSNSDRYSECNGFRLVREAITNTPTFTPTSTPTYTNTPVPPTLTNTPTETPTITQTPTPTIPDWVIPLPSVVIDLTGEVQIEFIQIPAGSFMMGASDEGWSAADEEPVHSVTIEYDFYMGKFEVTQTQWQAIMGSNPSYFIGANRPVESVSWYDCKSFVTELSKLGKGIFKLPTEAEWEYCYRAGTTTRFYFGDSDGCDPYFEDCAAGTLPGYRSDYMWYGGNNSPNGSKDVGLLLQNAFGLYDMSGNVWEWGEDDWHSDYSGAPSNGSAWINIPRDSRRIGRGGGWGHAATYNRSSYRSGPIADGTGISTGLRLVYEPYKVVDLPGSVTMEFARIPAGSFEMGSTTGSARPQEGPVHTVNIGYNFYMCKTEITQAQWEAVMGSWPGTAPSSNYGLGDNHPAYYLSWDDCQNFVTAINALGQGTFRLPSEAEWEYACRAGSTTRYYFGESDCGTDDCDSCDLDDYAWWCGNDNNKTESVGGKIPNAFGLYDMHGNVREWCQDYWHDNYNNAPTDGSAWESPTSSYRVLRSGSWYDEGGATFFRSTDRRLDYPNIRENYYGFRLVLVQ